jgi:nucleoside-diphosphate-sugar epimerase
MRSLPAAGHEPIGIDIKPSPFTHYVGSITDRDVVRACIDGVEAVLHAATHPRQAFVDTNISGTLNLLEEAAHARARAFIYTSTTSAFGRALVPPPDAPAAWVTEAVRPVPKNIYGVTKLAAEDLCELFHRRAGLPCLVLRTSRFFPEMDDRKESRAAYADQNLKANELLHRRVDVEDVVGAHVCALRRAADIGFGRYIVSATTPFTPADLQELRVDAPAVVARQVSSYRDVYAALGWKMRSSTGYTSTSGRGGSLAGSRATTSRACSTWPRAEAT